MFDLRTGILALLGLVACLEAYPDTYSYSLLAWSSSRPAFFGTPDNQQQITLNSAEIIDRILTKHTCVYDAIVVIEQPGLSSSDLRSLPKSSFLAKSMMDAPASLHLPHLQYPIPIGVAKTISQVCERQYSEAGITELANLVVGSPKIALTIHIPELRTQGRQRKVEMAGLDRQLSHHIEKITHAFDSYLVLVVGTVPSSFSTAKRAADKSQDALNDPFRSVDRSVDRTTSQIITEGIRAGFAAPTGGVLKRYRLLTPGLITSLGITFLLFLPLLLVVVNALAGIRSPVRSESIKRFQDKKNQ